MAYILNPGIDIGLNLDPRELYVKLVTMLNTTLQFYKYCYNIKVPLSGYKEVMGGGGCLREITRSML
jgi:hypothetical protein